MPQMTHDLIAFLQQRLGDAGVLSDPQDFARYTSDWAGERLGTPLAVARPATTEQVSAVVAYCHEHRIRMVPQGGHTGLVGGALPDAEHPELVISLERLDRIRDLDAINFTMTVDAGCVLQHVKDAAQAHDCFFPLSLGAQGSCQIGGNIATNAGGINVLRYGMMREQVLGLEVVLPDGRIWQRMQALHKDNRGYDLTQLFIGSEGTLGIITGAILKLSPSPRQRRTALLGVPSVTAAMQLYGQARRTCSDLLSAFELIPHGCLSLAFEVAPDLPDPLGSAHPWYVLMETSASGPVDLSAMLESLLEKSMADGLVEDGVIASSEHQADQLWQLRERMLEGQQRRGIHLRTDISVPISRIAEFFTAASKLVSVEAPSAEIIAYGHVGDGNLHFNVLPPPALSDDEKHTLLHHLETRLFEVLDDFDGSLSAEHGIGRFKRDAYLQRLSAIELALLRGFKQRLDPHQLMSPGRILPPSSPSR